MSKDITPQTDPIWVIRELFSTKSGIPASTIRGWQARYWIQGVHYQVIGRTTLINQEEVNSWLSQLGQNQSGQQIKQAFESDSKATIKPTTKPSLGTTARKLISKQQLPKGTG